MVEQREDERVEALIPQFKLEKVLNRDVSALRVILLGTIKDLPGLLLIERTAFASDDATLASYVHNLASLTTLSCNDIYAWFMGKSGPALPADLKLNLIWPCTAKHIAKYSPQRMRVVTETPQLYKQKVLPYILGLRSEGRTDWVFNILEGRKEQEDIIYKDENPDTGVYLIPDLNWNRTTVTCLHLLALVVRRDIMSLRDLKKSDTSWLRQMQAHLSAQTANLYPEIDQDQLKFYVHYQPTYYHFHIHVVHVQLESGATQSVGKAFGFENIIAQLEALPDGKSMADVSLTYTIGESHDLWKLIYGPLKSGQTNANISSIGE